MVLRSVVEKMLYKDQTIHIGSCIDVMKSMEKNSIQTAVTSPPYNIQKKYGEYKDDINFSDWKELMDQTFKGVNKVI